MKRKRSTPLFLVISIPLLIAGCLIGPSVTTYGPAHDPAGLSVRIEIQDEPRALRGELLAVTDSSLIIERGRGIVEVHYRRIRDARFTGVSGLRMREGRRPDPQKRRELTLLSRYPQGIDEPLLAEILQAYGSTKVEVIE